MTKKREPTLREQLLAMGMRERDGGDTSVVFFGNPEKMIDAATLRRKREQRKQAQEAADQRTTDGEPYPSA